MEFYEQDVISLARALLGQYLVTCIGGRRTVGKIVETEAYNGAEDRANHAFGNRRTARTEVMFGEAGRAYVYLCYGVHHLFNVVTGPPGDPSAVLIRAVEPVEGLEWMQERRGAHVVRSRLTNGPGKLCQAMGITLRENGTELFRPGANVSIRPEESVKDDQIVCAKRVGVDYAREWKDKLWRFYISGHDDVSVK